MNIDVAKARDFVQQARDSLAAAKTHHCEGDETEFQAAARHYESIGAAKHLLAEAARALGVSK